MDLRGHGDGAAEQRVSGPGGGRGLRKGVAGEGGHRLPGLCGGGAGSTLFVHPGPLQALSGGPAAAGGGDGQL